MILKIAQLLFPINYSLFYKNKNRLMLEYYMGWFAIVICIIFAGISFSTGQLYETAATAITINYIFLFFFRALLFFFVVLFVEAALIYITAKTINLSVDFNVLLKACALSYLPLILYAPAAVINLNTNIPAIFFIFCWLIILKIKFIKLIFNSGFLKTFVLMFSPIILFLIFSFFIILTFSMLALFFIRDLIIF